MFLIKYLILWPLFFFNLISVVLLKCVLQGESLFFCVFYMFVPLSSFKNTVTKNTQSCLLENYYHIVLLFSVIKIEVRHVFLFFNLSQVECIGRWKYIDLSGRYLLIEVIREDKCLSS